MDTILTRAAAPGRGEELRLAPSIGYSMIGQIIYLLAQLAILVSLTQLRGPEAVGEFGLALALTTPFFMFVSMGGKSSQASDVVQRYSFAEYAGLISCLAVLGVVGSIAAGIIFARSGDALLIVVIVALTKAAESISNLAYGAFQQSGRPDRISSSLLIRGALTVPLFIALLWAGVPLGIAFLAQLSVWSAVALLRDYPHASRMAAGRLVAPSGDWRRLLILARETAPLGASYAVNALLTSLPRIFVERMVGLSAVGFLTVVSYFLQAGSVLASSVSRPLVNRFARLRHRGQGVAMRRTAVAIIGVVSALSAAGILLVALAGEWILATIFGPEFAKAHQLLMLIAVALAAQLFSILPHSLLHADRRYGAFLVREISAVLLCALLLALLVPSFGIIGAGYAIAGAAIFRLVAMVVAVASASGGRREKAQPSAVEGPAA